MPTKKSRGTYTKKSIARVDELTTVDMLSGLVDILNKQASEPNLHAYQPHPKQIQFHESEKHQKLFIGGNRSGKTVAGVTEDLWWATRRHPYRRIPGDSVIRGRVLGDGFDNGTINEVLIPTFKRWIIPSDLVGGSWEDSWNNREHTLTFDNGSFIEFKSYDQDIQKHAGTSRHFIHFDEEPPQSIFAESMLRLVDTDGSWWMTMTPLNGMNWVYDELYKKGKDGELREMLVVEVVSTENPYVSESALEILLATLSDEEREQRQLGKFAERGGKVFPEFGLAHIIEGEWYPEQFEGNWRIYQSLDHGLNNPTAAIWHAVSDDNRVITFGEHYKTNMIVKEHARHIKSFEQLHGLSVYARPADPATKQRQGVTGTSIVQAYAEEGIFLNTDVPRDVSTGLDRMRTYMRLGPDKVPHWQIVQSQCPNLVRELERLSWKTYASAKQRDAVNKLEEIKKKDDHAFDSSRYFFTMMPDLAPSKLWHFEDFKPARMKTFTEVLTEMAGYSQQTAWKPLAKGFSDAEYAYEDGLETV